MDLLYLLPLILSLSFNGISADKKQAKNDFYDLQKSQFIYPATFVMKTVQADSVIECCMLCSVEENCLAISYVTDSKECYFVNDTVSQSNLSTIGEAVSNAYTYIKADKSAVSEEDFEAAPCTDPIPDNNSTTSCSSTNHQSVVALLAIGDRNGIAFLGDGTFVYCEDTIRLRMNGYNCDAPQPLSDLDASGWFSSGPPDAAVEDLTSGNFFLFKGKTQ